MRTIMKLYGSEMRRVMGIACVMSVGFSLILWMAMGSSVLIVKEKTMLEITFALMELFSVASQIFSFVVIRRYFGQRSSFFMQIPVAFHHQLAALFLVNGIMYLLLLVLWLGVNILTGKMIEMQLISWLALMANLLFTSIYPIFVAVVVKERFSSGNDWIIYFGLNFLIRLIITQLGNEWLKIGTWIVLFVFCGYASLNVLKYHFNASEYRN